jgi:hypothetical protein
MIRVTSLTTYLLLGTASLAMVGTPVLAAPSPDGGEKNGQPAGSSPDRDEPCDPSDPSYREAIRRTAAMVWDPGAVALTEEHDLDLINLTWEDTGRYYNSSVGPNISDMTIQVQSCDPETGQYSLTLMPVIRHPNFADLTSDISPDHFYLLVGNEKGDGLERVSLTEYLRHFRRYLNDPDSWAGREDSLLAGRDTHALVSAQAAFLPVPESAVATFNPVLFNYQSYQGDPAVLAIVATREGTSATVIDNVRDGFPAGATWGQRLFFNQDGERASFTGERATDFLKAAEVGDAHAPQAAGQSGLNTVLLIQVPLKQKQPLLRAGEESGLLAFAAPAGEAKSDVEKAVIGHGDGEGPFTEIDGLAIERDERFPIRVTVQFYKATSNGMVSAEDIEAIAGQIRRVYEDGDYVGSLVVDGGSERPTEYEGSKIEPAEWWRAFWSRYTQNTGLSELEAKQLLRWLGAVAKRVLGHPVSPDPG